MNMQVEVENPKQAFGSLKACIQYIPMKLTLGLARVFELGARKYGQKNWRIQPVRASTYYNAMFRHMVEWFEEGIDVDPESGQHPLLHAVACAYIILDGLEHGMKDDRQYAEVLTGKLAGKPIEPAGKPLGGDGGGTEAPKEPKQDIRALVEGWFDDPSGDRKAISSDELQRLINVYPPLETALRMAIHRRQTV